MAACSLDCNKCVCCLDQAEEAKALHFVINVPESEAAEAADGLNSSHLHNTRLRKRAKRSAEAGGSASAPVVVDPPLAAPVPDVPPNEFNVAAVLQYDESVRFQAYKVVMDKLFGLGNAEGNSKLARVGELFPAFAKHERSDDQLTNNSLESFHNWLKNIFFLYVNFPDSSLSQLC